MSGKAHRRSKRIIIILGVVLLLGFLINWLMTFRLEDTLRNSLRQEVAKATDGFYDCSFDGLNVNLFTGELLVKGLKLYPDSTALLKSREDSLLPTFYFDVFIDSIDFKGVNLTWKLDYRKLFFKEFSIKNPSIKVFSPLKELTVKETPHLKVKTLYESVSSYFDEIHARYISLEKAQVEYFVEDLETASYSLKDFDFTAYNFLLDEHSQDRGHLLYSDDFSFKALTPQVIFDSQYFLFGIDKIELSTLDSIVHIGGANFYSKDEYWEMKQQTPGRYARLGIGDFKIEGIEFSRRRSYNFLEARRLAVSNPTIELYQVKDNEEAVKSTKKKLSVDSVKLASWSLYAVTSPLLESINVGEIDINQANLVYVATKGEESDRFDLDKLDFYAYGFVIDAHHQDYNVINNVEDFSIHASQVEGYIKTKNVRTSVEDFKLSSINRALNLSKIEVSPISLDVTKDQINAKVETLKVTNIQYGEGLDADTLYIKSPKIDFVKKEKHLGEGQINNKETNRRKANEILDLVAPFIEYLSVKDIVIDDANGTFNDRVSQNIYTIKNLDFRAKNFHIDETTRRLRDYFFRWDRYKIKFRDFDNLTPDHKYRIKIAEGNFDSVEGDMLLKSLEVIPKDTTENSYAKISVPYIGLLGLDEKGLKERRIAFRTLKIDNPFVEVVERGLKGEKDITDATKEVEAIAIEILNFDSLTILSPSFYMYNERENESVQVQVKRMDIDSLRWSIHKDFSIYKLAVESPYISVVSSKSNSAKASNEDRIDISSFGNIDIRQADIFNPIIKLKNSENDLSFIADNYHLSKFYWNHREESLFEIGELDLINPVISLIEKNRRKEKENSKAITREELINELSIYANQTRIGRINLSNLDLSYSIVYGDGTKKENNLTNANLLLEGLYSDLSAKKLSIDELAFNTKNITYPLSGDFYTLKVGDIDFSKKAGLLNLKRIRLEPAYPKFDFAYIHPRGADWFDVEVDDISVSDLDIERLILEQYFRAKKLDINHVVLQNLKNQKIEIEHNIMPLLYEDLQKFPIKYQIDDVAIRDFSVIYEELPKKGFNIARIPFSSMNGNIKNFTNIQEGKNEFYTLHADGLVMGTAPFTAEWKIPVDSVMDKFYLEGNIRDMDMRDFNQLVTPMAPAYVKSGRINQLYFSTEATSVGATVDMSFEYDSLQVVVLKRLGKMEENTTLTRLVNRWGIEEYNYGKTMRNPHKIITRDPYHSTFNYFWQILQPPLIESVGVTEEKQNILYNINVIGKKVKKLFRRKKK